MTIIPRTVSLTLILCSTIYSTTAFSESPYSLTETLAIKQECIELGRLYAQYVDSNNGDKVADLFDDHGTFEGSAGKYTGKESIALAFGRRPENRRSHHVVSNEIADVQSRNLTTVDSYYVFYRFEGELSEDVAPVALPYAMGSYHDECVRTNAGKWLFQKRTLKRRWLRSEP